MIVLTMVKFYHKSGILSTREHTMTTAAMCHLTQFLFTAVYCQFHNGTEGATTGRKKHFMSLPVVPPPIVLDKQEGESPATFFRHYISFSDCCSFIGAEFILGGGGQKTGMNCKTSRRGCNHAMNDIQLRISSRKQP